MAREFNNNAATRLSNGNAVISGTGCTIAAWMYSRSNGTTRTIANAQEDSSLNVFSLTKRSAGTIAAIANDGTTIGRSEIAQPALNEWHHVAARFISNTSRFIYLDGVAGTENTDSVIPAAIDTAYIGIYHDETATFVQPWDGFIAEVAMWNIALSAGQIASLAGGARPDTIAAANLRGYWPLCGVDSPEPDLSGNGFNMTITGTVPSAAHPAGVSSPCTISTALPFITNVGAKRI